MTVEQCQSDRIIDYELLLVHAIPHHAFLTTTIKPIKMSAQLMTTFGRKDNPKGAFDLLPEEQGKLLLIMAS